MLNSSENNPLLPAGREKKQPAELEALGWFEPLVPVPPAPKAPPAPPPAPEPKPDLFRRLIEANLRRDGVFLPPLDTTPEMAPLALAPAGGAGDVAKPQPSEAPAEPEAPPAPPPRVATAVELLRWLKPVLLAMTHLQDDAAELADYWLLSTFFQPALRVLPCLVVTGNAYEANQVLHALHHFCPNPIFLAGLQRSHLNIVYGYKTFLIFEPNLNRRTAELLSCLTDKEILVVNGQSWGHYATPMVIYAGENPDIPRIQNSIHIHLAPSSAGPPAPPPWMETMIDGLPVHLDQYRQKNLDYVMRWTWVPSGLSSETAAIAAPIGSCIVNAPELRRRLLALLKTQDKQRRSELSNTDDAVVLQATLLLYRDGREQAYARDIADKANSLREARGETARLRPENIGHCLKRLGLHTSQLSKAGNGLRFDKATVAQIEQRCAAYGMEDTPAEAENLHGSQATEKK